MRSQIQGNVVFLFRKHIFSAHEPEGQRLQLVQTQQQYMPQTAAQVRQILRNERHPVLRVCQIAYETGSLYEGLIHEIILKHGPEVQQLAQLQILL